MRRCVLIVGLLVLATGGVYLWQASLADDERYALEVELDEREREIEMGRAAAANAEELASDLRTYEMELEWLRLNLPPVLGLEAFLEHARTVAAEHQVEVRAADPRLLRGELYDTARIKLELEGEPEAAAAVIGTLRRGSRIVGAEALEVSGRLTRVHLLLFSTQGAGAVDRFVPCAPLPSRVWAPGLRGSVTALRAEVEVACTEAEALAEHVQKVNALFRLREEVQFCVDLVDELVPLHRLTSTEDELEVDMELIDQILAGEVDILPAD